MRVKEKSRANKNGGSRATYQWLVMVLSNGERSIECAMQEVGKQIKAGQELRLLNIPIFGNYVSLIFSPILAKLMSLILPEKMLNNFWMAT